MALQTSQPLAIITGASSGIGYAVGEALAHDGYRVALIARREDKLRELCSKLNKELKSEDRAISLAVDITDPAAVHSSVQGLINRFGRVDLLFNNAGIYLPGTYDCSAGDFDKVFDTNMGGTFALCHEVVPQMKKQGSGYIFNLSSIAGIHAFAGTGVYSASKFAMRGFSESLHRELSPLGIKVSALCPHWVNTDMADGASIAREDMIQTEDLIKTVRWLLSLGAPVRIKEIEIGIRSSVL